MSGKSIMNKFVIRNMTRAAVSCSYLCFFYMVLLCLLDTAGVGANKLPEEDISMVTEINNPAVDSSGSPTDKKTGSGGFFSSDVGFVHAFIASFSVIIVSELGDKTFFIAAIMAMRHPRLTVFTGAIAALALMTVLSAIFGMAATIIPRVYTYYISTALFALFGLKMLKEGYYMSATEAAEELEEVQSDLRKREDELIRSMSGSRKETVELVPLNDHDDSSKAADLTGGGGSTLNGSIHSLVSGGHDLPPMQHHHHHHHSASSAAIRMSASASQLPVASNHHLASLHHSDSSNSINRNKHHGSSKSLAVTSSEQTEQRQRTRAGPVNGGVIHAVANGGTIISGLTEGKDNACATNSLGQSKRVSNRIESPTFSLLSFFIILFLVSSSFGHSELTMKTITIKFSSKLLKLSADLNCFFFLSVGFQPFSV
ncbi:uncharacterized protein LOC129748484 [Uranotaenia lowii]|uniref:uncharacterized protein LOC129748484 n=1 Tax=Uranotaenia lowii TaxID=190385 RepID=UPI0024783C7C|nr:uncharacterized protein LOC129748484 [Uranotaenia lowii]